MLEPSYTIGQKTATKEFTVTVLNKQDNKPVEGAQLTLKVWSNTHINNELKNTDVKGQASFLLTLKESLQHQIFVEKDKYYPFYDFENNNWLESVISITERTPKKIILYLTSDSLHVLEYYDRITPHYQIDTLIQLLSSDNYRPDNIFLIPRLTWKDIPRLLEVGNDRTEITNFPRNGYSSTLQSDCYLGIISLWLIESIRIAEGRALIHPREKFPSLVPYLCVQDNKACPRYPNTVEVMTTAHQKYMDWWQTAKNMNKREACKIDPLKETNLSW